MGKRTHIKRVFKNLRCFSKASALESASIISGTALESRSNEPSNKVDAASTTENRSHDAPNRDLWALALEKLPLEEKDEVLSLSKSGISKLDILRLLNIAAVAKQTECEKNSWKFELKGRQIILRDVVGKVVAMINRVQKFGDIAVGFDPVHASLPWAGIKFLLEMTVAESQQMGALLTGVEKMTLLISRCEIYEALYLNQEHSAPESGRQARSNLVSALVALYATMLGFFASAIRAYNQGVIRRTFCAVFNPTEMTGFHDKCQHLENDLATAVDDWERVHNRQIQTITDQRLKQNLVDLEAPLLRIDTQVASMCERMEKSERLSILQWISSIPYEENHNFACYGRTVGTGKWLLRDGRYREWLASSASMILWLHGDPGAGKTKLVSTVIDDLSQKINGAPNDEALAYFYCDRNQSDRQDPTLILSSFVRQLSTSRESDVIPRSTVQMYNQKQQKAFASGKLSSEESKTLLANLFQMYPQVTLVVDALDECDTKLRLSFIITLESFVRESSRPVKILISSRHDGDIKYRFEEGLNLEIRATDNRSDIAMFVDHEITHSDKSWQDRISSELKGRIRETLVEKSEGMFQWVALQIAALRELYRESDIQNRLGKLPETLGTAYDDIYQKIKSQKGSKPIIANRAFQWIMCSCWPLSQAELVAAVCQDPDTNQIDKIDVDISLVLSACQNLLVVDKDLNICRFSHLSVQEYFETHHWSSYEADCLVGRVCLSMLIYNPSVSEREAESKRRAVSTMEALSTREAVWKWEAEFTKNEGADCGTHDLLKYVYLNWVTHVQRVEENEIIDLRLTSLLKIFFGSMDQSSSAYQSWHESAKIFLLKYLAPRYPQVSDSLRLEVHCRLSPCTQAALGIVNFGFYNIIRDWWAVGFADIDQKNSGGDSLLVLGALSNSLSIAQDLLKQGADINASGGKYGSALQAASYYGFKSIVELLLDNEANVNASGGRHGSALQAALSASHRDTESVVQLLLEKGADVNASGGVYNNALQAASSLGLESVVQMLLDKGANVNTSGGKYDNALNAASHSGSKSVVQLLLNNGADVNASSGDYGSALQVASSVLLQYTEAESVVQLLLEKGADVNASGGAYDSALQAASIQGIESVVQLLLDKGADVNFSGGKYGSALQAASYSGSESLVQLLLDNGADVNASGGRFGSALRVAASCGYQDVVQLLEAAMKPQ